MNFNFLYKNWPQSNHYNFNSRLKKAIFDLQSGRKLTRRQKRMFKKDEFNFLTNFTFSNEPNEMDCNYNIPISHWAFFDQKEDKENTFFDDFGN